MLNSISFDLIQRRSGFPRLRGLFLWFGACLCVFFVVLLSSCAQMKQCEMIDKSTAYASGSHWYYSWFGNAKNTTMEDVKKTKEEGWWGCKIEMEKKK